MSLNRTLAGIINASGELTSGGGLDVYATLDDLPTSGLTSGDQAFVSSTSRFYISNGSGWYNVALINATPSLSISPEGAIQLATDGSTTTITLTATDSDYPDAALTFSVESDGSFGGLATLSQDSSVFTITPLSEDSATTTESTLTFKASDGISFGSGTSVLSLTFNAVNSNYTTALLKADTAGTDNQVDASTIGRTITEGGNTTSTAFTPYHPGGYSTYFDGSGGDYIKTDTHADFAFQDGDFTIECWYYPVSKAQNYPRILHFGTYWSGSDAWGLLDRHNSNNTKFWVSSFSGISILSTTTVENNKWYHLAIERSGTTITLYVNGTAEGTASVGTNNYPDASATSYLNIGNVSNGSNLDESAANGYVRDVRIVKGSAVYTSDFTPPKAPLTAIANTSLLTCYLPYIADGSTNGHAITAVGNVSIQRFGPYDYLSYAKADHSGSIYSDGTGDYMTTPADTTHLTMAGDFTIDFWYYPTAAKTNGFVYGKWNNNSDGWAIFITPNWSSGNFGYLSFYYGNYGSNESATSLRSNPITLNAWHYCRITRESGVFYMSVNGKVGTRSNYGSNGLSWSDTRTFNANSVIGITGQASGYTLGEAYLADLRVIVGTALTTGDFTPPTAPVSAVTNTKLLTCANKNDIWDVGSGARLIKNWNVAVSNTQRKFITSSAIAFDGSGDSVSITPGYDDPLYNFGTHDWTLEFWAYFQTLSSSRTLFSFLRASANEATPHLYTNGTDIRYYVTGADKIAGTSALTVNTWHHIAVTRSGNDHKVFVDGTQVGSTWTAAQTYVQGRPVLGDYHSSLNTLTEGTNLFHGYMQDVRITKGLARYTSSFTPPTTEFSG